MTTRLLTFDEALHLCQAVDFVDDDSWRRILTEAPQRSRGGALMVVPIVWLSGASAGIAALWTLDAAVLFGVLWTLAATAVFMAGGLIASKGEEPRRQWPVVLRVAALVLAACGWLVIWGDQMPCFLGEPNYD